MIDGINGRSKITEDKRQCTINYFGNQLIKPSCIKVRQELL